MLDESQGVMTKYILDRLSQTMTYQTHNIICQELSEQMSAHMLEYMSDELLERMSDRMPATKAGYVPETTQIKCHKESQNNQTIGWVGCQ